jgi:small subunit ribosomal protein S13
LSEFRHVVRLAGTDIEGTLKVIPALARIKGVGWRFAHALLASLKIDPNLQIGQLKEREIAAIEAALKDPTSTPLPRWLFNRRKDLLTGQDLHIIGADWDFNVRMDIEREKQLQTWRGVRHALGLKVRGQRTRTTGRTGMAVGVRKAAAGPGKPAEK